MNHLAETQLVWMSLKKTLHQWFSSGVVESFSEAFYWLYLQNKLRNTWFCSISSQIPLLLNFEQLIIFHLLLVSFVPKCSSFFPALPNSGHIFVFALIVWDIFLAFSSHFGLILLALLLHIYLNLCSFLYLFFWTR